MVILTKSVFLNTSYSFKVLLKSNTNCSPCLFRFDPVFVNIFCHVPQNRPGLHQRYRNLSSSPLKDSVPSVLYWHCSGRWSLGYSRVKTGRCWRVYDVYATPALLLTQLPAGDKAQLRFLPGSRPAKRPGYVNRSMLSGVPPLRR
jgi:hypothetical protein